MIEDKNLAVAWELGWRASQNAIGPKVNPYDPPRLAACVFCDVAVPRIREYIGGQWTVECLNCHAHGPLRDSKALAIKGWENARVD